jgi:3-dehydroquinate dehydratase-2
MKLAIINGPNLNLLGQRETNIYGTQSFENYWQHCQSLFPDHQISIYQSNIEGEIVNFIQSCQNKINGIVINAAAYTHTSVAIRDALIAVQIPFIEVHISNVYAREPFRHQSLLADKAIGVIAGLGMKGYELALTYLVSEKR